jgi:adenine-specific DNA methylase
VLKLNDKNLKELMMNKSKKLLCVVVFLSMIFGCSNKATSKEATENKTAKDGKIVIKIGDGGITDKEIKEEIDKHIPKKLEMLWEEGISGADYFVSAIGSAIEIFGKYKKIMDYEGREITTRELLEYVRHVVTDYTVRQILHNGIVEELSPLTKFYILWRWTYGESKVEFDDARKLAQSIGVHLEREWSKGFISKEKEFIKVLGPQERKLEEIKEKDLIDILYKVLLLWKEGRKEELKEVLKETGYGTKEAFYRVAQAISETLPIESKEKKLLDGFLSGKEKLKEELKEEQRKLF